MSKLSVSDSEACEDGFSMTRSSVPETPGDRGYFSIALSFLEG